MFRWRTPPEKSRERGSRGIRDLQGVRLWLSLVDLLCSEYGWPLDAVLDIPVARALCLRAAIAERNGVESGGLTYLEIQLLKNLHG